MAVKILTGREVREAQRFDQEAAILAGLVHPAIVRYITHGVADSGARYIAMEWLDGEDLATRLEREHPTIAETVALARRTAEALAYAHQRGVVHRDIKPGNLFLPGGAIDRLKVLDFGIARLTSGARKLTRTGSVIGTPGYMAPELVRGARDITPRADVFSLGCVMFQCLTGRAVFEAEAPTALLAKILLVEAPRVRELAPHVPAAVDDCVARMLAKDPERAAGRRGRRCSRRLAALGPLGDGRAVGGARAGGATIALTASERRIACVVIAGPSATGERRWSGETPPAGTVSGPRRRRRCSPDSCAGWSPSRTIWPAGTARGFTRCPTGRWWCRCRSRSARPIRRRARRAARWPCAARCPTSRSWCRPGRGAFRPGRRSAR